MKDKEKLLLWSIALTFTLMMMFLFLQQWTIAIIIGIALLRNIAFFYLKKNNDRVRISTSIVIMLIFAFVPFVIGLFTWAEWYDLAIVFMTPIFVWGLWQHNTHIFRTIAFVNCMLFLTANIIMINYMGIAIELSFLASLIVFYFRFYKRKAQIREQL